MLDIRFIRENPDAVRRDLERRGGDGSLLALLEKTVENDKTARQLNVQVENLRAERNRITEEISQAKKAGGAASAKTVARSKEVPAEIKGSEENLNLLKNELHEALLRLPNTLHESVPFGKDDSENSVVRTWGEARKHSFEPKGHEEILLSLGMLDLERAAKISGSRFYFMKGDLVLLDMSLQRFAADLLIERGFTVVNPPAIMGHEAYMGVTDLGTFEEMLYKIDGEPAYLIATSEHPLGGMMMDETLLEGELPLRLAGISPCFRKEAGAHGKDTKGIFRVHQFNKIEQFVFCNPNESWKIHEELIDNAEEIFRRLEIPHRVVNVCTGDIGTVAAKKYDLEAWMPVQGKYREMVSCSNCTSYQAVRLNVRFRKAPGTPSEYLHTLNSTAIATTRAIVALIENFQTKDGTVNLPKALWGYVGKRELAPIEKR
ncbi:MAG: serine--tRNA ligase [archaeon]